MKFTTINSLINITDDNVLGEINKGETHIDLSISAHVEESDTRYITLNITRDTTSDEDFDIYLDIDIYQAELFAKKIQSLVNERKLFLKNEMNENTKGFYCKNETFVKHYYGEYCEKQCEKCFNKNTNY